MTEIYYFSGTGNSLWAARRLESLLGDARVVPITQAVRAGRADIQADRLVLVFPVYFQTVPRIVRQFAKVFHTPAGCTEVYAVATCNGGPGHALFTLGRLLKRRGLRLAAGFTVDMPGNSLILRDFTNPPEVQQQRLQGAGDKLQEVAGVILGSKSGRMDGNDSVKSHVMGFVTGTVARRIYRTPRRFTVTADCNRCGACARVCPKGNIQMGKGGPKWGGDCEQCLACFHWCPKQAIEIGRFTQGKRRYRHPDIKMGDMCT